jgi:hypothetical protein
MINSIKSNTKLSSLCGIVRLATFSKVLNANQIIFRKTAEPDMPGMQIQDLELLKDSYKDVYDTYLQNELQAAIGTWFRLPLRNEAMAKESGISKECVDVKSVDGMLSKI